MSYGELPARTSMRGYYKMENTSDSSGNSRTLNNVNTVSFNSGKYGLAADFGNTANNKNLTVTANPMSALTYANATFSFWVKFNSTSRAITVALFDLVTRLTTGTGAARTTLRYTVTAGNFVLTALTKLTTTDAVFNYSIPVNTTNWYHIVLIKSGTTTTTLYVNGVQVGTATGSGSDTNNSGAAACLNIGNRADTATNGQAWAMIDEFIYEERVWSQSEIRKYYSQGRGFLIAA